MSEFAIGDIHGCATSFRLLLEHVQPGPSDTVVLLGDYVDRGPDSRTVLDVILELSARTTVIPLQGNHEIMMLNARLDRAHHDEWLAQGGTATLRSYSRDGAKARLDSIPEKHWLFLREQVLDYWEADRAIFVHATVDPDLDMTDQPPFLLFWQPFRVPTTHCSGKPIICGHTPQKTGLPACFDRGICIDTGVCSDGWLTCYDLDRQEFIQANERGQLRLFDLTSLTG